MFLSCFPFSFFCKDKRVLCSFVGRHVEHVMYFMSGCARTASASTLTPLHELLTSEVLGRLEQRNQIDRRRDCGSIAAQLCIVMLPASMGLTRGYMPYQDPVYSQPKKLPATHFHITACRPLRKQISLVPEMHHNAACSVLLTLHSVF